MEKEVILFRIGGKKYGVEVGGLQGIESYNKITPVSNAPKAILGITELRDTIYPVLDFKVKFDLPERETTGQTSYLLLRSNGGDLACIVDEVIGIHMAPEEMVQDFPLIIKSDTTSYVDFVVKIPGDDDLVIIINPKMLFAMEEAEVIIKMQENNILRED